MGIVEKKSGEKEGLLDDLIAEIDTKNEDIRAEKDEQAQAEKPPVAAGEVVLGMTLKGSSNTEGSQEENSPQAQ